MNKLKEILKSRGGWIGAVIGLFLSSFCSVTPFIFPFFKNCGVTYFKDQIIEGTLFLFPYSLIYLGMVFIPMILAGFIIGYFIEKRFKKK